MLLNDVNGQVEFSKLMFTEHKHLIDNGIAAFEAELHKAGIYFAVRQLLIAQYLQRVVYGFFASTADDEREHEALFSSVADAIYDDCVSISLRADDYEHIRAIVRLAHAKATLN